MPTEKLPLTSTVLLVSSLLMTTMRPVSEAPKPVGRAVPVKLPGAPLSNTRTNVLVLAIVTVLEPITSTVARTSRWLRLVSAEPFTVPKVPPEMLLPDIVPV